MKIKKNGAWENFILPVSVPTMKGASDTSDGTKGLVPQPSLGDQEKFLKGDGSWAEIPQPTVTVDEVLNATSLNPVANKTVYAALQEKVTGGLPVGHEFFTTNPNIPAGCIPLLGGEYSRTVYADLWAWVQTQTGYLKSESDWQALSTANNGNVPYYSSGDGSTTFRVPSLKCWVKGANGIEEVGSYLEASEIDLTNHYHGFGYNNGNNGGSFLATNKSITVEQAVTGRRRWNGSGGGGGFDSTAQTSVNMITSYAIGESASDVYPESIVGMWLVKAYGTVSTTGNTTTDAIATNIEELNNRVLNYEENTLKSHATAIAKMQSYFNGTFTKTLLWGSDGTWSNANSVIELSQPWRDFDGLIINMAHDDSAYRVQPTNQIIWKWEFEEMIRLVKINPSGQGRIIRLHFGDMYLEWRADGNMPTDTTLTVDSENCGIFSVYGISLKANGITNTSAIDVSDIQDRVGSMLTTDGHLKLPSGLEVW